MPARRLLSDVVYEHLREQILRGGLLVGNRLSVAQISQELEISRTPVKQAIAKLCADGILRRQDNRQALIVSVPPLGPSRVGELPKFEYSNQTEQIHGEIYKRILSGVFQPGQSLHELPLARELSAHGATVSRALEWLCRDGLLERLPRRGWRLVTLTVGDLEALYEIRMQLEPMCFDAGFETLEPFLDEVEEQQTVLAAGMPAASLYEQQEADFNFHTGLMLASGNKILAQTLGPLIRKAVLLTQLSSQNSRVASLREHAQIIKALRDGDHDEAAWQLTAHLRNSLRRNLSSLPSR